MRSMNNHSTVAPGTSTVKRLVVLVSGSGTNLQAIIDCIEAGSLPNCEISAVISNRPNAFALTRAQQHGIQATCLDHTAFSSRAAYDQALADLVAKSSPDFIILAGFMRILTPSFIEPFIGKIVNIHPSLLPKHKGLHTHRSALEQGDHQHGCSVHFVTVDLDSGPILAQASFVISEALHAAPHDAESPEQLLKQQVQQLEYQLYPATIRWLVQDRFRWDLDNNRLYFDEKPLPLSGKQLEKVAIA